ncbi:MAG TPA: SagB/ThcOx family dehydrogenase [Terriglobales bacterium]|nr:SagB/ThcOx family dehydrogenase [Terriglobales bacterium]
MPTNRDLEAAWKYHNATKHSYASVRTNPHRLDWDNKPTPYKIYPTLEVTRLPREARPTGVAALSAIATTKVSSGKQSQPNLESLAQLLFLSAGITKSKKYPGGETFFRAAACTGALYEIELYVVCGDLPELAAGVYHFGVAEFGLRQLRAGDYRQVLAHATGNEPAIAHAPLTIICTGTYWRNAWKYQARTYRHFGWDNGTILANLLAASVALGLPVKVVCGFVDEEINRLLDLDTQREVAFSLAAIGHTRGTLPKSSPGLPSLGLPLIPLSKTEVDYPAMREMHGASSLTSADEVMAWRRKGRKEKRAEPKEKLISLELAKDSELPGDPLEEVILRRGSTRQFAQKPIGVSQLSAMLDRSTRGIPADFLTPAGSQLNDMYLIVNAVEGLGTGSYFYHREKRALELLRHGNLRKLAGYLGLEQQLPADGSVAVFFLADLRKILERFGNRGYRAAQLEAGILGGKLYLSAYAQRLGATGLTFYDDDVVRFFSPHAEGKIAVFLVALGKSA